MSTTGPPADAKQAQAAALQELENAQRKKRGIDTTLVSSPACVLAFVVVWLDTISGTLYSMAQFCSCLFIALFCDVLDGT